MGEAAEDEDGHTEDQRQHLALAGKLNGGGHDESAADSQQETGPGTFRQSSCEYLRGWFHTVRLGIGYHPGGEQTAHDVAEEYDTEHGPVTLTADEPSGACIEFQTIINDSCKAEGEENSTGNATNTEVDHASDGDADAGENGQREGLTKKLLHVRFCFLTAKVGKISETCKDFREVLSLKAAKKLNCDSCDSFFLTITTVPAVRNLESKPAKGRRWGRVPRRRWALLRRDG